MGKHIDSDGVTGMTDKVGGITDKKALRRRLIAVRDGISPERHAELSAAICRGILSLPEYAACDTLLGYCPVDSEWDIRPVLHDAAVSGRRVVLPRCDRASHTMTFHLVTSEEDIESGEYGIPAPRECCTPFAGVACDSSVSADAGGAALCLVPALALDGSGRRIGYGGGYYDRFLPSFAGTAAVPIAADFTDIALPTEEHDFAVSLAVTERGVVRFRSGQTDISKRKINAQ